VAAKSQRQGRVKGDYGSLWLEMGARRRHDGDYELDCEPLLPPSLEDVPSKKRSGVRKRHELLDTVAGAVLGHLAPNAPPPQERSKIELV